MVRSELSQVCGATSGRRSRFEKLGKTRRSVIVSGSLVAAPRERNDSVRSLLTDCWPKLVSRSLRLVCVCVSGY